MQVMGTCCHRCGFEFIRVEVVTHIGMQHAQATHLQACKLAASLSCLLLPKVTLWLQAAMVHRRQHAVERVVVIICHLSIGPVINITVDVPTLAADVTAVALSCQRLQPFAAAGQPLSV